MDYDLNYNLYRYKCNGYEISGPFSAKRKEALRIASIGVNSKAARRWFKKSYAQVHPMFGYAA